MWSGFGGQVTRTDYGRPGEIPGTSPLALLELCLQEVDLLMGAAQSTRVDGLAQFDVRFTRFMREGSKDDATVLLVECLGDQEGMDIIPAWKKAAVYAAAKCWNIDFTEEQDVDWNVILRQYSILPRDDEFYAPILDMTDFLDVAEMLMRGWDLVWNLRVNNDKEATSSEDGPLDTDVNSMVTNRLEVLMEQSFAYPQRFVTRLRTILYYPDWNVNNAGKFLASSSSSSETPIPPLIPHLEVYSNPPSSSSDELDESSA
jgi:hypothetical protein